MLSLVGTTEVEFHMSFQFSERTLVLKMKKTLVILLSHAF